MLFFGAAMILMMIFRNQGIIPSRPRQYLLDEFPQAVEPAGAVAPPVAPQEKVATTEEVL
jgi:hypothetical protein